MIVHLVLFRFKPGITRGDPRVGRVASSMDDLPVRIGTIRAWEHGFNEVSDPQAWDYGLRAVFDNRRDLEDYFAHPDHLPVLAAWEELADLAFADFEA